MILAQVRRVKMAVHARKQAVQRLIVNVHPATAEQSVE